MAIVVTSLGDDPSLERSIIEATVRRQIDGLIIAPISSDQSYLAAWQDSFPIVFIDRMPTRLNADYFVEDDFGGAFEATQHLIAHGHRRIAIVGDSTGVPTTRLRLEGYRAALEDGRPWERRGAHCPRFAERGRCRTGLQDPAGAAGCAHRHLLLQRPVLNRRFSCPAGAEQNRHCAHQLWRLPHGRCSPAVGVGHDQDPRHVGMVAAERVLARIATPAKKFRRKNVLPVELIERQSCQSVSAMSTLVAGP